VWVERLVNVAGEVSQSTSATLPGTWNFSCARAKLSLSEAGKGRLDFATTRLDFDQTHPFKQTIELFFHSLPFFFQANNMAGDGVSHEEIWDDSALLTSWDDALAEYKVGIRTPIL
jgi:hypothetical protein